MSTIAQQLNITEFPYIVRDENGNMIYFENSSGCWNKREYDSQENIIYYETSDGFWVKQEFDSEGNRIYFENSRGEIEDNRPQPTAELTIENIAELTGASVEQVKAFCLAMQD